MNNPKELGFRFHSLNALRFFAFFLVYLKHINGVISSDDQELRYFKFLTDGGAVEFFFVLGGFLFTFLLIKEKETNPDFSFLRFYAKRILRTWPLFYIIILSTYLMNWYFFNFTGKIGLHMVSGGYWPSWKHSLLFLENYKMWEHHLLLTEYDNWQPMFSQLVVTWSLCVQEHFYLVWPLFIMFVPNQWIPRTMVAFIFLSFGLKMALVFHFQRQDMQVAHDFFTYLDLYSIGGLLGYYAYHQFDRLSAFISQIPRLFKILFTIGLLFFLKADAWFDHYNYFTKCVWNMTIGIGLTTIIAFFMPVDTKYKFSENSIFSRIGKMSYSLYLIHLSVIHMIMTAYVYYEFSFNNLFNFTVFGIVTLTGSIVVSFFTYSFIEQPFLRLKKRLKGRNFWIEQK